MPPECPPDVFSFLLLCAQRLFTEPKPAALPVILGSTTQGSSFAKNMLMPVLFVSNARFSKMTHFVPLQTSNITKAEEKKNPQAVLNVLKFYNSMGNGRQKCLSFSSEKDAFTPGPQSPIKKGTEPSSPNIRDIDDGDDDEAPPPVVALRPKHTKSVYTRTVIDPIPAPKNP
uniref:Uncharacterized protein n=1 Tax=Gouania willdenowi TaxID=441366 RepID=A0A8C5ELW4_GOUWI